MANVTPVNGAAAAAQRADAKAAASRMVLEQMYAYFSFDTPAAVEAGLPKAA